MRPHHGNHRDLARAVSIAFDWRKCLLGGGAAALLAVGLEALIAGLSLGRWHLFTVHELLRHLELTDLRQTMGLLGVCAVAAVWALYVFSYLGGAIARLAAIEFTTGRRAGLGEGLRFAQLKFRAYFWSPAGAILLAGLFVLLSVAGGAVGRIGLLRIGPTLVALLYGVSLLLSVVVVILLLGVLCAWGLMFSAVAVEKTDNFDAVSRSLNYLYSRPWFALAYRLLGCGYGAGASSAAVVFAMLTWGASRLAIGLGMGPHAHQEMTGLLPALIWGQVGEAPLGPDAVLYAAVGLAYICLISGYVLSYLFSSQVIQYLLLRRLVDGIGLAEIALAEPPDQESPAPSAFLYDSAFEDAVPAKEVARDPEGVSRTH